MPGKFNEREIQNFAWIMSDPRGRAFVWSTMGTCRMFGSVMAPVHPDVSSVLPEERLAWNAGRQEIGQGLYNACFQADPSGKLFGLMSHEANNRFLVEQSEKQQKNKKDENDE